MGLRGNKIIAATEVILGGLIKTSGYEKVLKDQAKFQENSSSGDIF